MNSFQKFLQWVIASSADPGKVSLMVKGVLAGILPFIVGFAGIAHITIPGNDVLTSTIDGIGLAVYYGFGAVASIMAAYGAIRKIWTTLSGTNAVIVMQQSNQE